MERAETGWDRPSEPAPRWRALLDRALLGRSGEQSEVRGDQADTSRSSTSYEPSSYLPPDDYGRPEPARPGLARPEHAWPEYSAPDRARSEYPGPSYGRDEYTQPDYGRPDYGRPEYTQPDYGQLDYGRPEYTQPEYPQPEYGRPDHAEPVYGRPDFAQPDFARPNYPESDYPRPDYPVPGYVRPEYSQPDFGRPVYGRAQPPVSVQHPLEVQPVETQLPVDSQSPVKFQQSVEPPFPAIGRAASIGLTSTPFRAEIDWRQPQANGADKNRDIDVLQRDIGGPRVLAFANPKGGVHKTTATVLTAATIGGARGRGVIAWDDNELRGTLGLRAGSARHARTIRHLVADLARVEAASGLELTGLLDGYLRHASDASYDVLAGEENPRFAQRLDQFTVRRVVELLRRTHDVICVDTGNNVESENWRTVLQLADQLVVTTLPREDAAFSADWMLDVLEETGLGDLVAGAVTLVSCPTPSPSPLLDDLVKHFGTRTRAVAVVPYDPALEAGSSIDHEVLQPATKKAWLAAAAKMLEPFAR